MFNSQFVKNLVGGGNSLNVNELHVHPYTIAQQSRRARGLTWIVFFISISFFSACMKEQTEASGKQAASQQIGTIITTEERSETHDSNIFHQLDSAEASDLWRELYGDSVPMPHWI